MRNKIFYRTDSFKPSRERIDVRYIRPKEPWEYSMPWWVIMYLVGVVYIVAYFIF